MPESGSLGSVRGAQGNLRPYRETVVNKKANENRYMEHRGVTVAAGLAAKTQQPGSRVARPDHRTSIETIAGWLPTSEESIPRRA